MRFKVGYNRWCGRRLVYRIGKPRDMFHANPCLSRRDQDLYLKSWCPNHYGTWAIWGDTPRGNSSHVLYPRLRRD